jgi:hypothetical protein
MARTPRLRLAAPRQQHAGPAASYLPAVVTALLKQAKNATPVQTTPIVSAAAAAHRVKIIHIAEMDSFNRSAANNAMTG